MRCALIIADGAIRRSDTPRVRAFARRAGGLAAALLATSFLTSIAHAQNATWSAAPATNDWNTAGNWSPATVPTGTASFGASSITSLEFSSLNTSVGTLQFNAGAPNYTFTIVELCPGLCSVQTVDVTSAGVVNNAAGAPTFILFIGGTLNFKNASTAANSNIVMKEGNLVFQNTSTAGSAIVTTPDAMHIGIVTFKDSSSAGTANFTMVGSIGLGTEGTVFFLDTSTAANATFTNNAGLGSGGTTQFGILGGTDTSNAGTAHITNNSAGATNFLAHTSAGNATITNNNGGGTGFQDQSTAANATITNNAGGSLFFGDQSTAGSATITNNGGTVTFGSGFIFGDTATAGNSTITNSNGGTTQFFDSTTAGNATITTNTGSSVQFFQSSSGGAARFITNAGGTFDMSGLTAAGMTAGSIEGAGSYVLGNKVLTVGGNNLSTAVSGVISGIGGALIKAGSGVLTLSGANTYTGGTTINGGTLQLGNGGTSGSILGDVAVTGALSFNRSDTYQFDGKITGFGGVEQNGTGKTILTANSHYFGPTNVNSGTLIVNGSISSSFGLAVYAGGTVGGVGNLPKTTINGGSLSPGNSIGTINIAGGLTFVGAGNYIVEVSPSAADKTNVTGAPATAILAGTLSAVGTGGSYTAGTKYTVLNATGGVSGTFGSLAISGSFGATKPHIEYDANNVYLVLDPNALSLTGLTQNERSVATAINTALLAGSQSPPFLALFNLTATQLPGALDQLSGEVHASTAGVLVDESLYARSAVLGRLRQASYGGDGQMASLSMGGPQAYANGEELSALAYGKSPIVTKAPPMSSQPGYDVVFWAQGFGARGRFDTDGNAANLRRDLAGFFSGADTRVGSDGRIGIAAGYTASRNNLDGRGSANVETGHLMGYGGWRFGALNLRAGGAYAWHTIDTDRTIAFPGFFDRATAHYNGGTGQIFGEAGYGFAFGRVAVEPFAGAALVHLKTDAFNERGGAAALAVAANAFEVGYSTLGVRAASMIPLAHDMMLVPRISVAWQHAFTDVTPTAVLAFQNAAVPFVIAGVPIARDSLLAEAGLDLAFGRHATLGLSYVGQLAHNVQDHAAKGKFSWKF